MTDQTNTTDTTTPEAVTPADPNAPVDPATVLDGGSTLTETTTNEGDDAKTGEPDTTPFKVEAVEGFDQVDTEALAAATPLLRANGIDTDEKAQAFLTEAAPIINGMVQREIDRQVAAINTQAAELKQGWDKELRAAYPGGLFDQEVALVAKAIDQLSPAMKNQDGTPMTDDKGRVVTEARALFRTTPLGDHPAMVRLLAAAGRLLAEDTVAPSDTTTQDRPKGVKALYDDVYQGKTT